MKLFLSVSVIILLISCSDKITPGSFIQKIPPKYDTSEVISLKPENMFYLRLEEYYEIINTSEAETRGSYNQASARLYRSIPVCSTTQLSQIVEEKYMYLEDYDNTSIGSGGSAVYFRTTKFYNNAAVRQIYSYSNIIDLETVIKTDLGYWYNADSAHIKIILTNGDQNFQVIARRMDDRVIFEEISHPQYDKYSRNTNGDQFVPIKEIINVANDSGLVYYRNVQPDLTAQRSLVYSKNQDPVTSVYLAYNGGETPFCTGVAYFGVTNEKYPWRLKPKGDRACYVIPVIDRIKFKTQGIVNRGKDYEKLKAKG